MGAYSLDFTNNSTLEGDVCLYMQYKPALVDKNVHSMAWFVKPCQKNGSAQFTWDLNYEAQYSESKRLTAGSPFCKKLGFTVDPDNANKNTVDFFKHDDYYRFDYSSDKTDRKNVKILMNNSIPNSKLAVGLAIHKQIALAVDAKPNTQRTFFVKPSALFLYIVVGKFGESCVIDENQMTTNSRRINFQNTFFKAIVTLRKNNSWNVEFE